MKFYKIGNSMGGGVASTAPANIAPSDYMNFITACEGIKVKWYDPLEKDAINLIIKWELALKHDNGLKVWDKTLSQHYRVNDKENQPNDSDLVNLITGSYLDFRIYLEKEKIDPDNFILPLDSSTIDEIRIHLLEVYNSQIQS